MGRKHQTTAANVTAELNQLLNSPVSTKTVGRKAAIRKPLLYTIYILKRLKWCKDHIWAGLQTNGSK